MAFEKIFLITHIVAMWALSFFGLLFIRETVIANNIVVLFLFALSTSIVIMAATSFSLDYYNKYIKKVKK